LLLEKKIMASMVMLGGWLTLSVYFMIMALSLLIYLSEFQLKEVQFDSHLLPFMIYSPELTFNQTAWINLTTYTGTAISCGFYCR
jgi:hypothetical protein